MGLQAEIWAWRLGGGGVTKKKKKKEKKEEKKIPHMLSGIYRAAAQFIVHDLSNSFQRSNDSVSFSHAAMV